MEITREAPTHPAVVTLCLAQQAELAERDRVAFDDSPKVLDPRISFVVAWSAGEAIGCAALQPLEPGVGELKRMYVKPAERGRGVARAMLAEIETMAAAGGVTALRLETGRTFDDVIALYTGAGFVPIPLFGPYVGNTQSACFEKPL
ncbi:N-acetyltransferase [Acrocarpospora phusangensis]|uniref:N-acetyltransferase n=1 Tax=Acrocarpospora phusangensis TaxID=1070424 RepID=A0A919QKN3_9ACTN|nr:GNAT family N-acetyltransferase [Acrocarpospora phusangensis]GIH29458.1 N-acetyltransferase [Acrocarpospora phusangensis]